MIEGQCKLRVMYSDTDQMGYLHHSAYLKYYETARWELFRERGMPYKLIEDQGYILPVTQVKIKYVLPARYDDILYTKTQIKSKFGARITLLCQMVNEQGQLINQAEIILAFLYADTRKPTIMPDFVSKLIYASIENVECD